MLAGVASLAGLVPTGRERQWRKGGGVGSRGHSWTTFTSLAAKGLDSTITSLCQEIYNPWPVVVCVCVCVCVCNRIDFAALMEVHWGPSY